MQVTLDGGEAMDGEPIYLGVDVAGASNTWAAALSVGDSGPRVVFVWSPKKATLQELVDYCEAKNVVAATIDAQLTMALSDEKGFRTSDNKLKCMLKQRGGSKYWVASINSLMAVPIRGRMLADHLSPTVATLLETHPRASLLFALGNRCLQEIREYKRKSGDAREQTEMRAKYTRTLWQQWSERFGISHGDPVCNDGELDSLVCATVAYLFHHAPEKLLRLRHDAPEKTGRGPFYVVKPKKAGERR